MSSHDDPTADGRASHPEQVSRSWQAWLADPSRTGTSPVAVLEHAVSAATGDAPGEVERLLHGELNEVYDIMTTSGVRLIVRIGRRSPSLFPAERWALEAAAACGAAVPSVLWIGEVPTQSETLAVFVESHAGGWPLQQVAASAGSADAFADVVREAGRHLALVHQVRTDGFGWPLDDHGRGPDTSWAEFLAMPARQPEWYRPAVIEVGYDPDRFDLALGLLEEHANIYQGEPRLVHADFGAKHVLVDDGLRAIIDFEVCRGGDPAYDVAAWDIYFHNTLRTDWLLEGYAEVASVDDNFDLRVRLCRMLLATRLLAHAAGGFKGFVPLATTSLDRDINFLT